MVDKDYRIKGFRPNWPPKDWWDEYKYPDKITDPDFVFSSPEREELFPDNRYVSASPEKKKKHLASISEDLLEEGYDWREVDEITRLQGRINDAEKLAKKAGVIEKTDGSWDTSQIKTDEQLEAWNQAIDIMDNVNAKTGAPVIVKDQLMDNYPLSELHTPKNPWYSTESISDLGEALWGTTKDVGSDLWNMTRELGHYPLYGIPFANLDVDNIMENYWPEITASDKIEISPEEAYGNWKFYDRFKDNMGKNKVPGLDRGEPFRWKDDPAIDEDSMFSWLNQSEPEYDIVTGEPIDDGMGWVRSSSVPDTNPWKKLMAERIRPLGSIIPTGAALALTRGRGIIPLVNRLPNAMRKTIGQILPFTSGQGTMWPKYTGANKFKDLGFFSPKKWGDHMAKRNWNPFTKQPSTYRNVVLSLPTFGAADLMANTPNNFEPISISDSWDREPVVFDSYMQEKLDNFEPRTTTPGPRNNYQGL